MKGFPPNIPPNAKWLRLTFRCQSSSLSDSLHSRFQMILNTFFKSLALFFSFPGSRWIAETRPLDLTEEVSGHWFTVSMFDLRFWMQSLKRLRTEHSSTKPIPNSSSSSWSTFQWLSHGIHGNFWAVDSAKIQLASHTSKDKTLQSKVQSKAAVVINSRQQFI